MKVLWIVNMLLPDAAEFLGVQTGNSGTWMIDISKKLAQNTDVDLAIACVHGNQLKTFKYNNITWYLLPGTGKNMLNYTKRYEELWKKINGEFQPDIVHIHGTEYSHGLAFMRACPKVKTVISIQGVIARIKDVYYAGIPVKTFLFNRTLKQNFKLNGEIERCLLYKKNAKYEQEMLRHAKYINGVNTWDISLCKSINPDLKAYKIDYNLREEIYNSPKWSIDNINRHTIFTNPGGMPLKGLHQLLMAVSIVKKEFPDVIVKVPGMGKDGKIIVNNAYSKYIYKLINKLQLQDNVEFLGSQTGSQMCENILSANVTVIPSAIEGTSLILREAMHLGCPCIASFRGGMADFVSDKQDGFLYDYQEYPYLAARIVEIFNNDSLARQFSINAIRKAEKAHDREKNTSDYIQMYKEIFKD